MQTPSLVQDNVLSTFFLQKKSYYLSVSFDDNKYIISSILYNNSNHHDFIYLLLLSFDDKYITSSILYNKTLILFNLLLLF